MKHVAFAGAGLASAVLARELVESGDYRCTLFEERKHVAGNCHTERRDGILVHTYGPHIFNTSREDVWAYVNRWATFMPFVNRVRAVTAKGVFALPLNLLTLNQFFGRRMSPREAREFVATLGEPGEGEPRSFEDQALRFLGRDLYENFFRGYTRKQWGTEPANLPASILRRLPVRFNYDDNYYNQKYQGLPVKGYTAMVERMLAHPAIEVRLGERLEPSVAGNYDHVFWSGPMDGYFSFELGRLRYRTLDFEEIAGQGDMQGNAVLNYCEEHVPYTRVSEHKHFAPWETHENSICYREYSRAAEPGDSPYYPLRLNDDKALLERYVAEAERARAVTFIGRLGTYRYLDMHVVIGESLDLAKKCLGTAASEWPRFSVRPI